MKVWAVLAGKHAAVAAGAGAGLTPVIGSATLDSFALGAVVAGLCVASLSTGWRNTARPLRPAGTGHRLALSNAGQWSAGLVARAKSLMDRGALAVRTRIGSALSGLFGDSSRRFGGGEPEQPDEGFWGPYDRKEVSQGTGYKSRHRLTDPSKAPRKPDGRRAMPRHAAPPLSFSHRVTGRFSTRALAPSWDH